MDNKIFIENSKPSSKRTSINKMKYNHKSLSLTPNIPLIVNSAPNDSYFLRICMHLYRKFTSIIIFL